AATHGAELDLELALVPRQQPVDRVLALQRAGLGVDHLAVAEVDRGLSVRAAGELDDARLAADLDGLDDVDHGHVGDAAGEAGAVLLEIEELTLPLLQQDVDPRDDFFDVDRLRQVVVDAELEPLDLALDRG